MTTPTGLEGSSALEGKVALVTGGASGIGHAIARRLRRAGARLVVLDVDAAKGAAVGRELDGRFCEIDVGEPSEWARIVRAVTEELGGVDIACLNAGVLTGTGDLAEITDEQYRRIRRANIDGVFYGARAVVSSMEARGGGAIVATASLAGLIAYGPDPVYALTKHAVVGLVRSLAPQLEPKHITVNAICPGIVDTPLVGEQGRAMLQAANFPLIAPEEIAEVVYGRVVGPDTGEAWVVQVGLEATRYRFSGVPGTRGETAGRRPPD